MRKNIRWSVDLRLLYIAYVFMYGLIVKFTISNSLLFKAKTYIPEVLLLFIALLGVKSNAWKMKRCFVLLLTFSALVVTVNIARHGLTEQGVYAIRDIYIPLTAFSCMMIPFTDNENEIYTLDYSNRFTAQVLYRLDYKWPVTDDRYLESAIEALDRLAFFD